MTLPIADITQTCSDCHHERSLFRQHNEVGSPACVTLFRFAIQNNQQEAWQCIDEIFSPQLLSRAGRQTTFDAKDVVQEAWASFYQATSTEFEFVDNSNLRPIISYLNRCVQTAVARMSRKLPPTIQRPVEDLIEVAQNDMDELDAAIQEIDIHHLIERFFVTHEFSNEDRTLFSLTFLLHLKPAEIMADYPSLYEDYDSLEVARQRIKRRVVKHSGFQNLKIARRKREDSVLLKMVTEQTMDANETSDDDICQFSDETLLDYIMETASAEIVAEIEAAPACLLKVGQLRKTMGSFLDVTYRMDCPSPDELVTYQRRESSGTSRLVQYRHIESCSLCREDLRLIAAVGDEESKPGLLQQIVEAVYHSPLALGLQGEWLHFRTSDTTINIGVRRKRGKERLWTANVQLRTPDGDLMTHLVEFAVLEAVDEDSIPAIRIDADEKKNSLVFQALSSGRYCLSIVTAEQEIIVPEIVIGS